MKDDQDTKTRELTLPMSKAARFRAKQIAAGLRQFSFWLTEKEAEYVRSYIETLRGQ